MEEVLAATASPSSTPIADTGVYVVGGIVMFLFWAFVLWIVVLVDILKSEFKDPTNKIIWMAVSFLLPFLGTILYFFIGRKQAKAGTGINMKAAFAALSFLIWVPLGVVLMWFWTNWPKWIKIIITVIVGILIALALADKYL